MTIHIDGARASGLRSTASSEETSEGEIIKRAIQAHTAPPTASSSSDDLQVSLPLDADLEERITAVSQTRGQTREQLIMEALEAYPPAVREGWKDWAAYCVLIGVVIAPLLLMFLSPAVDLHPRPGHHMHSATWVVWTMFSVAMVFCLLGLFVLVFDLLWGGLESALKFGPWHLVLEAGTGVVALVSAFTYLYWLLSHIVSGFFSTSLSRIDALYFAVNTFTTTGTGELRPMSGGAKLLVSGQAVLGFAVVAIVVAIVVTRGLDEYKRYKAAGVVVRLTDA